MPTKKTSKYKADGIKRRMKKGVSKAGGLGLKTDLKAASKKKKK
jgi:hypothetical protein